MFKCSCGSLLNFQLSFLMVEVHAIVLPEGLLAGSGASQHLKHPGGVWDLELVNG